MGKQKQLKQSSTSIDIINNVIEDTNNIIETVESFICHFRNGDYTIDPKGAKIEYSEKNSMGYRDNIGSLPDLLAKSILKYEVSKRDLKQKISSAYECLNWIDRARAFGIVNEGIGLVSKYKECSEQNTMLLQELQDLSGKYAELKGRYEELKEQMEDLKTRAPYS